MELEDIPKFGIDEEIFRLVAALEASKEACRDLAGKDIATLLTKASLPRSVNASLAIEGNGLGIGEVSDIACGRETSGYFDEVMEVKDASKAYAMLGTSDPWSIDDFLRIQDEMMFGLVEKSGFRTVGVGVFQGDRLVYKAPDPSVVEPMVGRLFKRCSEQVLPVPIVASIAHFYIESIHPFVDGNGRMGRFWNAEILVDSDPIYRLVPMEVYINRRREEYYAILEECQHQDGFDCTRFVKFCLECLISAFDDLRRIRDERMEKLLSAMSHEPMTLREIMDAMGAVNRGRFTESYLRPAMDCGLIVQTESKNRSRYQRYRRLV